MNPYKKVYYFKTHEIVEEDPFKKLNFASMLEGIMGEGYLLNFQLPPDLTSNAAIYNELYSLVMGRYSEEYMLKIEKWPNEEPTVDDMSEAISKWIYRYVSLLNITYEYYVPLLTFYRANKTDLMDDITAISRNKIKYNDTPQNANTSDVYEGDDYITQFTKTEGESISPLTTKINRLKEIQDGYKNVMADWVKEFEKLFMEAN